MLVAIAGLLTVSCDFDLLDVIDINFQTSHSAEFTVPPTDSGNYVQVSTTLASDIEQEIEDNKGSIDKLESIVVESISIVIDSGVVNFNAFKSAEIKFSTNDLSEIKVIWIDSIPMNATVIYPEHTSDNLKDYLNSDEYTLTFKAVLRKDLMETTILKAVVDYKVQL